jgi:hypothetical protein
MKTAALVCDNYKVEKFKSELAKAGFQIEIYPFNNGPLAKTTNIKAFFDPKRLKELKNLIHKIEISFKQSN